MRLKAAAAPAEIRQNISALNLEAAEAELLQVPRQTAALETVRHYLDKQGRTMEVARSLHPAGTFTYSTSLQLRHAG